ncbi:MAG: GNAT family N-acetyltransferase [Streptococcaceae bacterium]|jgi:RimJ/RimL family protein N-acetyltransferase|nr:GNAT family N-acetyltransferase [Streptococcaceae bacterium]
MKEKQEIILRQMEPRDFAEVSEIENTGWTSLATPVKIASSPERYIENIQAGVRYLLAVNEAKDDKIFAILVLHDRHGNVEAGQHVLTFSPLVVESARHQGLGTFLVDFVKTYAAGEGYSKITIEVLSTDLPAIGLYEKSGFIREGLQKKEFLIDGKWVDNLWYAYFIDEKAPEISVHEKETNYEVKKSGQLKPNGVLLASHEYATIISLTSLGYDLELLPPSRIKGQHTPDLKMDGRYWEMKAPKGESKSVISHILKKALMQSPNIILDLRRLKMTPTEALDRTKYEFQLQKRIRRLKVILKNNDMIDFER